MRVRYGDLIRIGRGQQQEAGEKIRTCIWPAPKNLTPHLPSNHLKPFALI